MKTFAALVMLLTLIVTIVIGVRLLRVAARTGELPEFLIGLAFLGGGMGQGLAQLGQRLVWTEPGTLATTMNASLFALVLLGNTALFGVVWRVFRPNGMRGATVAAIGVAALFVGFGMRLGGGEFVDGKTYGDGMRVVLTARISLYCWISLEAFRYGSMLVKRVSLGLADPVVAHQILLWGVAGVANMALTIMIAWYTIELGRSPLEDLWATCAVLAGVSISVSSIWCAFFPPKRYAAWLRARAAA